MAESQRFKRRNFWFDLSAHHPYYYPNSSIEGWQFTLLAEKQPKYVCNDCSQEWSYWHSLGMGNYRGTYTIKNLAQYHQGECDCCGEFKDIADIKNFGYFYEGWQDSRK